MMIRFHVKCIGIIAVMMLSAITAAHAQVIPAARAFTNGWRNAGMTRDIPTPDRIVNVKDYGARGDGTTNDAPAIIAAMTALGATGGVVFFPAGKYNVPNNTISIRSNVVFRGERSFNTEIIATNLLLTQTACLSVFGVDPAAPWFDIQSGYDLNSSMVTLTDVTSFVAGEWVELHQGTNAAWKMSNWPDMIGQIVQITNVTVTTSPAGTLTLVSPLRLQYQPGLPLNGVPINPQIRKFNRANQNVGVENLRLSRIVAGDGTMRNNVPLIYFRFAVNCWVRGCEFTNIFGSACSGDYAANIKIAGNYMHHAYEFDGGGSGYGVVLQYRCSEFLVENNIFATLRHSVVLQAGVNGNVIGYNYSANSVVSLSDLTGHGNYTYGNLFEGNCASFLSLDSSHGANGPHNAYFRNRARGVVGNAMSITDPIGTNQTFVGNEGVGSYSINRLGIFEYGNNDDGTIKPTGTDSLADYSYYLGTNVTSPPPVPEWWNIPGFIPVYGPTNVAPIPPVGTERDIPARVRFFGPGPKTYAPPSIWRQPTNQWVLEGDPATFSVGATGTPYALYQWYKEDGELEGETNDTLNINSAQLADQGCYYALVSDSNGYMRTAAALLSVHLASVELVTDGAPEHYSSPVPAGYGTQVVVWATVVTNQVASPIAGPPGTQYWCTGWTGTGSVPPSGSTTTVVVNVQSNSLLTWQWANKVQFARTNATGGTVTGRTNGWYWFGTNIVVTNVPSFGYHFTGWTGTVPPSQTNSNPLILTMDQTRSVTATFAINSYTLTVASVHGSATPPIGDYVYTHGRVLTNRMVLMDTNTGSRFTCTGWVMNGNAPVGGSATNFTMTLTNTAILTWNWQSNYYLRFTNSGPGSVNRTNGWYGAGSNLFVSAIPSVGYGFRGWAGDVPDGSGNNNPLLLPVDQPRSIVAQFLLNGMMLIIRGQSE